MLLLPFEFLGARIGEVDAIMALHHNSFRFAELPMSHATIDHAIQDFFRSPSVDRYLAAQFAIIESDEYEPAARQVLSLVHCTHECSLTLM